MKKNSAKTMRRVVEAMEGVKRSNGLHQNKDGNDK